MSVGRPAWSAGIAVAPPTPVSWHIRQLSRPSSGCGVAGGAAAGLGAGASAGAGAGAGVGAGAGSLEHAASSGTVISSATIISQTYFFITSQPPYSSYSYYLITCASLNSFLTPFRNFVKSRAHHYPDGT